jgi:predicted nucleotidyltransferase
MTAREEPHIETADLDAIRAALDGTDVVFALLFGSHARSEATGDSDLDIAVRFPDRLSDRDRFRARNRIDATLQAHAEGTVDVSDIDALPVAVQHAALRDGIVLYGDDDAVAEYREQVTRSYESTADERTAERQAFIDRLARGDT